MIAKAPRRHAAPLKSHLGFWMRTVSNTVSQAFARKLDASGVTVAEWVVLREMFESEATAPSRVADLTGMTRGAVSKLIERLLQKGLATRTEAEDDRRYQNIRLTKNAVALVPKLAAIADQNDSEFFSVLTVAEKRALLDTLKKLAAAHGSAKAPID